MVSPSPVPTTFLVAAWPRAKRPKMRSRSSRRHAQTLVGDGHECVLVVFPAARR
jgi:hypothetical protein